MKGSWISFKGSLLVTNREFVLWSCATFKISKCSKFDKFLNDLKNTYFLFYDRLPFVLAKNITCGVKMFS